MNSKRENPRKGPIKGLWLALACFIAGAITMATISPLISEASNRHGGRNDPSNLARGQTIEGRAVHLSDGDSFVLLSGRRQYRIRIEGIDAPESNQPWGRQSKNALGAALARGPVQAHIVTQDRYGRLVADISVRGGSPDIGLLMISTGNAWVYRQYDHAPARIAAEDGARRARLGLWALPRNERIPPWEWRHRGTNRR